MIFDKYPMSCFRNPLVFGIVLTGIFLVQCKSKNFKFESGAIIRGDRSEKSIALVFTGDEFAEGGYPIVQVLSGHEIKGSFFLTGKFYRNNNYKDLIQTLIGQGHYLGAHSDQHLLYCSWDNRDSLLVTKKEFKDDLLNNYREMEKFGITKSMAPYFLPPYEWYNDSISFWTNQLNLSLINYTPGTRSHADYTTPDMDNYQSSEAILKSILDYEDSKETGLNGFILLTHIGAGPLRKDKFFDQLDYLIQVLKNRNYTFERIDHLLT